MYSHAIVLVRIWKTWTPRRFVNSLRCKRDRHLISSNNITPKFKVKRIKEMVSSDVKQSNQLLDLNSKNFAHVKMVDLYQKSSIWLINDWSAHDQQMVIYFAQNCTRKSIVITVTIFPQIYACAFTSTHHLGCNVENVSTSFLMFLNIRDTRKPDLLPLFRISIGE